MNPHVRLLVWLLGWMVVGPMMVGRSTCYIISIYAIYFLSHPRNPVRPAGRGCLGRSSHDDILHCQGIVIDASCYVVTRLVVYKESSKNVIYIFQKRRQPKIYLSISVFNCIAYLLTSVFQLRFRQFWSEVSEKLAAQFLDENNFRQNNRFAAFVVVHRISGASL